MPLGAAFLIEINQDRSGAVFRPLAPLLERNDVGKPRRGQAQPLRQQLYRC